ncbi:desulfoferrodoxin family protein [Pectobacteriaceae bacterium CE70]|nr:desulfoferrodoxin family protein [Pectobacteriaceae bacterium C52]WJV65460.1 desulfoferrodoxin family protein [Pectobacteriaceae bacterium CE70]
MISPSPAWKTTKTAQRRTRIRNSTKPGFIVPEPIFYRCGQCRRLVVQTTLSEAATPVSCCGTPMSQLVAQEADSSLAGIHRITMVVSGGFDSNALSVTVGEPPHPMETGHYLEWIYLYTFQGGQIKFMLPGDLPSALFSLAEKDAYVYCDRAVCKGKRCKFNCKRGFCAFCYCSQHGLWRSAF